MFINKINITNFGRLTDININPRNGLNVIYAPNEAGKTTLLSFIKYILYGTKQKKNHNDITFKEKYTPWNGMPTGGSIELCIKDEKYLIERVDSKNTGNVKVTNLKNGEILKIIRNPGIDFLGIGERAFVDSCFVNNILSITDGHSDGELISRFSYSENENNIYFKILNSLNERLANLVSVKRKSSSLSIINKKIEERQERLRDINKSIKEIQDRADNVILIEKKIDTLRNTNKKLFFKKIRECINLLSDEKNELLKNYNLHVQNKRTFSPLYATICMCINIFFSAVSLNMSYFIYPALLSGAAFLFFLGKWLKSKIVNKEYSELVNEKNELLSMRISEIDIKLKRLGDICKKYNQMLNADIAYINSFTNSNIDDIINKNENEISDLQNEVNRNLHYRDKITSLNDELYDITAEIFELETQKISVKNEEEIINKAIKILNNSYDVARNSFFPEVSQQTLKIYSRITGQDFDSLITDDKFNINLRKSGHLISSKYLSSGAIDALYFSLRIAIINKMAKEGTNIPLFLDDILSNCDDKRAYKILDIIYSLSKDNQIFISTCRSREGEYFKDKKDVNIISL